MAPFRATRSLALSALVALGGACGASKVAAPEEPARQDGGPSTARPEDAGGGFTVPDAPPPRPDAKPACPSGADEDNDHDGYTVAQGDCNDCDRLMNPGAFDVADNRVDEDCSGTPDDEPLACDEGLPLDGDALAAARALGLCRTTRADAQGKQRTWGVLKAAYVFPDGTTASLEPARGNCAQPGAPPNPLSHGVLPKFGDRIGPRQGKALVALSSGIARSGANRVDLDDDLPDGSLMCTHSLTPPGFPVSAYSTCGDIDEKDATTDANDAVALELVIRAPTNAQALSFDFDFYTIEYHDFVCTAFNDAFVALLYSQAPGLPANHNIAFDSQKNPVSVNNGFVEVCSPATVLGMKGNVDFARAFPCKLGTAELEGTGFEAHAATGWLETHANVVPGEELTLRFAIWDARDELLDSTVLLDRFTWSAQGGSTVTVRPPDIR